MAYPNASYPLDYTQGPGIARGRDACDVPMLQTFGPHVLKTFRVVTEEIAADPVMIRAA